MNVFVIGATGYIGTALCEALGRAGHRVAGTSRSEKSDDKLRAGGVQPVRADVRDPASLVRGATAADATIYSVQYDAANSFEAESAALRALTGALAPEKKTFIYTSGVWLYGDTGGASVDENAPVNPATVVAHRPALEKIVLDATERGLRAMIIRPGDVYGRGGGMPAMWTQSAEQLGAARIVGEGNNHWPVVHVDDLAELYVLALERGQSGAAYNVADESSFTVREMAEAASRGAGKNGAVQTVNADDARKEMGPFADALMLDSLVSAQKARDELGWEPHAATIVEELAQGSYAKASSR